MPARGRIAAGRFGSIERGAVTEFLEDELKPKTAAPAATPGVHQTMAALGVKQRASSWKTPPPEAVSQPGILGVPYVPKARRGGFVGFLIDHALVLTVFALAMLFFMIATIMTRSPLGACLSGIGILMVLDGSVAAPDRIAGPVATIERHLLIFGACFAIVGLLLALGAWRSQMLRGVERRSAEKWRMFELVAGIVIVAVLTLFVTWRVGLVLHDIYEQVQPVVKKYGWRIVDTSVLVRLILWIALIWAVVIGQCVAVQLNSQRKGFFRLASMAFVGDFLFILTSGFLFYLAVTDLGNHQRRLVAAEATITDEPETEWTGPAASMKARPVDPAAVHPSKFVGAAVPDDHAIGSAVSNIAQMRMTDGDDPATIRNRAVLKWRAGVDFAAAGSTAKVGRQPAIALPTSHDIVAASTNSPLAAVRTSALEEGSTYELWDLSTGQSRGKISQGADLSTGLALSGDGRYLSGVSKGGKAIEIWSFETGKYVARIPLEIKEPPSLAFADNNTLLGLLQTEDGLSLNLWPVDDVANPRTFLLPSAASGSRRFGSRSYRGQNEVKAISPGGKYLALQAGENIWLVDLNTGQFAGGLKVPSLTRDDFSARPNGIAFSPDGKELVFHCDLVHGSQVSAWSMADGALTAHWQLAHSANRLWDKSAPILYPSDSNFWLIDGQVLVDRRTGREWPLTQPEDLHGGRDSLRVVAMADADHVMLASNDMLSTWEMPLDVHGRLELENLKIDAEELPKGMIEKPLREQIEERAANRQPIEGNALVDASRSYRSGTLQDALASDDQQLATAVRWYPAAKQPAVLVRWGVGIQSPQLDPEQPSTNWDLKKLTGNVGAAVVAALEKRIKEGAFGTWPERGDPRICTVIPLGIGTRDELLNTARQAGIDAVVVLELNRQVVGRRTEATLKARLSDVTGEPQWSSQQSLSSARLSAQPAMADQLVDAFVSDLMKQVDAKYKLQPLTQLNSDQIKDRVSRLTKSKALDTLTALAELRAYQTKGLLSADAARTAYRNWLDDEGANLLTKGTSRQRRAAIQQWLDTADREVTIRGQFNP